jgi:hypothetical protein
MPIKEIMPGKFIFHHDNQEVAIVALTSTSLPRNKKIQDEGDIGATSMDSG